MRPLNKIIWALGLLSIFLFILLTGRTNIRNFEKVQRSIEEIYEDRLVVNGLIFDLSSLVYRKQLASASGDQAFYAYRNASVNARIEELLAEFRATRLTELEEKTLERFTEGVAALTETERALQLSEGATPTPAQARRLAEQTESLHADLKTLSRIQLSEGKRHLSLSDRAVDSMNTFARIENYMLLITAAILLALVFLVPGARREQTGSSAAGD